MKSKSFGALKRLKSLYYVSAIAVPLLSGSAALAIAPTVSDYGAYYGSTQIFKGDMSPPDKNAFRMIYSGSYQKFIALQKAYREIGTVYYKLGENGTWSNKAPNLRSIGKHNVYYYVVGNPNYNDFGSASNPKRVLINIVDWGKKVEHNGIINYVDSTGKTSAEINKNGIIWIKAESGGNSSWYGLDNSSGFFENGSRFWVKWLSRESNPSEYQQYLDRLDDVHKEQLDQGRLRLFLTGVTKPDGTQYTNLPIKLPYYIQLEDGWDENSIHALIVSASLDRSVETQLNTATYFEHMYGYSEFPDTSEKYVRLVLDCFAPFAIYNETNFETVVNNDADVSAKDNEIGYKCKNDVARNNSFVDSIGSDVKLVDDLIGLKDYGEDEDRNDYGNNSANAPKDHVDFLIIEVAITILLLSILGFGFKTIYKHRDKNDNENKSL